MLKIMGQAVASVFQMRAYIKKINPAVPQSVIDMIPYYISEGAAEGVRGDIAFAQSCLETGNFTFSGSAVTLDQNNFAGIGVTKNGMKGNSWKTPQIGIRAQIQHLKAYACDQRLNQTCVDPRFTYVKRASAPYVEHLGIQENPTSAGWAAGAGYGSKIINILNAILAMPGEKEGIMNINTSYISNNNSYAGQVPLYIVIHNTDNYNAGANAKAHAKAQHDGNFSGMSAHIYVDDKEAYQAMPYDRGAWHVGVNYGGRLFGIVNNRNSIGIEMCINAGYDYEKAFQNTVRVCKQIMKQFGIPAERIVQHYDICNKNCPSAIRARNDWNRFKSLIAGGSEAPAVDKYYRIRKSWEDSKGQIGAYKSLENAKKDWKNGYVIYDWNGKQVYPAETKSTKTCSTTDPLTLQLPVIETGCTGVAVKMLQTMLGTPVTGTWNEKDVKAFKEFQKNTRQTQDGICGENGWTAVAAHMRANTRK